MSVPRDDPILLALEEEFAALGIETGREPAPRKETKAMLPREKTPARMSLSDLTVLVHGPAKIGKSTLCSRAEKALFIATEAGLNALEVYQVPVTSWNEFLAACGEVAGGEHGFKTIVVDTLDNAYLMCQEYICAKHKIEHPADLAYGKGFSLVNTEFYRVLNKLSLLPYGLFLVCHSQEKEIETRTGKRTRIVPTLPDKARRMVLGMVDVILYCDVETVVNADGKTTGERRIMRTKPTETYEAGDRTGRLPDVLDLDYAKFAAAFAAGQGRPSPDTTGMEGARGADGLQASKPQPDSAAAAAPSTPPASEAKPRATDERVLEFEALVADLKVPPDTVKQRLAQFGATEPSGLSAKDMETILARLRTANARKTDAGAEQPASADATA
jgi:hypothetical protein